MSLVTNEPILAQNIGDSPALRVMSFNIRLGVAKDGPNHWDLRKQYVAETIRLFDADIVGTQETWNFQAEYLQQQLPDYVYVGRSRQPDSEQGEQCGILFKRNRFDKLTEGHFWLSETPDQPGSKSWDSSLPRMVTWLKLWDQQNQQSFYVLNSHFDHRGEKARLESGKLIRKFATELQSEHVVITGDFNAAENAAPYQALFAESDQQVKLIDTFRSRHPDPSSDTGTFGGFKGSTSGARIDWIAVTTGFKIEAAEIDRTEFDGRYPSDHYPVTAILKFNRSPRP